MSRFPAFRFRVFPAYIPRGQSRVTNAPSQGMLGEGIAVVVLTLLVLLMALALLPLAGRAAARIGARLRRWSGRRSWGRDWWGHWSGRRWPDAPWLPRQPGPTGPPIERLSADLRRLIIELDRLERSNPPAKAARMRATTLAYDDVLLAACRALEVDLAARPPLRPLERLEAEAELARHGLRW